MVEFEDLGLWAPYTPDEIPEGYPLNTIFFKDENGRDWYEFWFPYIQTVGPNDLFMTAIDVNAVGGYYLTQAVQRDPTMIVPGRGLVIRISGADPTDPKPWKAFEQRAFDRWTLQLNDIPPPPKYFISKADLWRRCTDEEAELLYADLRNAPARYQALFDGATVIDIRDDFFPVLEGVVKNRVTDERAAELLEPTF